jgi:DNA-binding PadR family transcriptional regulator
MRPSTFTELLEDTSIGVSRPTLSKLLVELDDARIIERRPIRGRKEYRLTEKGKREEELRRQYVSAAYSLIRRIGEQHGAGSIFEMPVTNDARDIEERMRFYGDFGDFLNNDSVLRWIKKHGRLERTQILNRLLTNIMRTSNKSADTMKPCEWLCALLKATLEIARSERYPT